MAHMKTTHHITGLITTLAALLVACSSQAAESIVTPAMVGHWEGNARIVSSWCHQTNLPVKVDIVVILSSIKLWHDSILCHGV
jgi:hypothetical protein